MTWVVWTRQLPQLPRIGNPSPAWSGRQPGGGSAAASQEGSSSNNRNQGCRITALRRTNTTTTATAVLQRSHSSDSSCGCHSVDPDVSTADGDDDIQADYLEIDSDTDSPVDHAYAPHRYREGPPTALERAHSIAATATTNLSTTANSLATTASSLVASAATTAMRTAGMTAAAGHAALRGVPASTADTVRASYDELRLRGPRRRLGLLAVPRQETESVAVPVVEERHHMSCGSSEVLGMDLSELAAGKVRVQTGLCESRESVEANLQHAGWEDAVRRRGTKGAGSKEGFAAARLPVHTQTTRPEELPAFVGQIKEKGEEDEWHDVLTGDDGDNESFDSCIDVLELGEQGEHAVEQAQRQFQQRQKEFSKPRSAPSKRENHRRRGDITADEEDEWENDVELIQYREDHNSSPLQASRRSREAVIQRSQPRRRPSPGSSKIAMISYNMERLPHSESMGGDKYFEWN